MGSGRFRYRIQPDQLPEPMGSGTGAETMSMATRSYSAYIATLCPIIIPIFMKPNGKQTLSEANESPFIDAEKSFYIRREFQSFTQRLIYRIIHPKHIIVAGNHSNVGFAFFH